MTKWPWTSICLSLAVIVAVMIALNWTTHFIYRADYPAALAVEVPGFEAPLVNRGSLQRSWPAGLKDLSSRSQLRAHMSDIENLEVPVTVASLSSAPAAPAPELDLGTLLASADISSGERRARICTACHTFDNGGRDGQGPNLWSVLGRDIAASGSFDYSDALSGEPGSWTYEKLDDYLRSPAQAIPGNKMAFQGVRRASDRADIIAYLRMQGASQLPLPEPAPPGDDETQQAAEDL